jgi:hypothetical protein
MIARKQFMGSLLQMKSKNPSAAAPAQESSEEFNQLLNTYINRFHPADSVELELVEDMVKARWRHRCLWRKQGAILELAMEVKTMGESERIALAAEHPAELEALAHPIKLLKLTRQNAEILRRAHEKALVALMDLRDSWPPQAA